MEWLILPAGIPTASELDALISPKFEVRTGKGPLTYVATKVAEAWQGGPEPTFQSWDMEQGVILESEARSWYEFEFGVDIRRVGFITTDDGRAGCSPDGLLPGDCGLEIKCPAARTHAKYLLDGKLPEEYEHQVHASMYVTGFDEWKFFSYCKGFPKLVLTVDRDEKKIAAIEEALSLFRERFDAAMSKIEKLNGGPPRHMKPVANKPLPTLKPTTTKLIELTYLQ